MQERMPTKFVYYLDESDPDIIILRRQHGSFVGAFSARGATREGIVEAAREDYRELIREQASPMQTGCPKRQGLRPQMKLRRWIRGYRV